MLYRTERTSFTLPLWLLCTLFIVLTQTGHAAKSTQKRFAYPQIGPFIDYMVKKHKFDRTKLRRLFLKVKRRPDIIKAMNRQAESLPWYRYRKIFMTPGRINKGAVFWRKNAKTLAQAEKHFGVPARIIVAIIGVETFYGERAGKIRILESLTTLAFGYPRRARFFRRELVQFLLMTRQEGFNAARLKGSYAGAMGMPQFMPSSYRAYAYDFDKDGRRDLFNNHKDVIGSVANYFKTFGWKMGQPVIVRASVRGSKYRRVPRPKSKFKPSFTLARLAAYGITPRSRSAQANNRTKVALIKLKQRRGTDYWLGYRNFYVITRYNNSALYAMAVHQLSQAIEHKYRQRRARKRRRRAARNH